MCVCALTPRAALAMKFKSVCEVFAQLRRQKCRNYARDIGQVIRKCGECDQISCMWQFIMHYQSYVS
jgi:hypothetical protein